MKPRTDDDELDFTIDQEEFPDATEPLAVRKIIDHIVKLPSAKAARSDAEQGFLLDFAAARDLVGLVEEFLDTAMEHGETVRSKKYKLPDGEEGGWLGIHRFLGLYVCSVTQYGERVYLFGPYATKKEADKNLDGIFLWFTPI